MRASDLQPLLQGCVIQSDPTSRFFFVASGNSVNENVLCPSFPADESHRMSTPATVSPTSRSRPAAPFGLLTAPTDASILTT